MLLPDNLHPKTSLYFNGAYVLKVLRKTGAIGFIDLYIESCKLHEMKMPIFVLTLDWLFLADFIRFNNIGKVELCS